jgi:hypothetical protein
VSKRISTRYEISRESLFKKDLTDGVHKHTLSDGTVIEAHVQGGRINAYTAQDSSGAEVPVRRLKLMDEKTAGASPATECMYCICHENTCRCWVEPCIQ